jgi:hypothetical protein
MSLQTGLVGEFVTDLGIYFYFSLIGLGLINFWVVNDNN